MRTLTLEIKREECVGDSIAKHNYNLLSLDTNICNLSSDIYKSTNNILTWFNDISASSTKYNIMAQNFSDASSKKYNINHTTIKVLSGYWNTSDFTVQFQHNNYYPDGNLNTSDGMAVNAYTLNTSLDIIRANALNYLNSNFPASNYNIGSRVNVTIFVFNALLNTSTNNNSSICYIPVGSSDFNAGPGTNASIILGDSRIDDYTLHPYYVSSPNSTGGFNNTISIANSSYNKTIKVDFFHQDINVARVYTLKYIQQNGSWVYTSVTLNK
jgi:hypothetical protein